MRSFQALSNHDFELLIADLLGADLGVRFEAFAAGPDGGVDLRSSHHGDPDAGFDVVQCKHYFKSSFSTLLRDAGKEVDKLRRLDPAPRSYRFVTSQPVTIPRKARLRKALEPFIQSDADIYGADDLDLLLDKHRRVEQQHVKLWLTGGAQLDALLRAGTFQRSRQLLEETRAALPRYVESHAYAEARDRLHSERILILSGPPGIGKTTLARMLLADAALAGYDPIEISGDIEEGNGIFRPDEPQIFYYDDFLGSTFLLDRLDKNEDKRLAQFLRRIARSTSHLLVLTTREYILRQATELYEHWGLEGIEARRFLIELPSYSRMDRARIFYNHIWASGQLDNRALRALVSDDGYAKVIDHPNYNPRLIEYITGLASHQLGDAENSDYLGFAVRLLDDPSLIWRHAFEQQLDDHQRNVLIAMASMPSKITVEDLELAYTGLDPTGNRSFARALRVLDDSFLSTYRENGYAFVEPASPSVDDFVAAWLTESPSDAQRAIDGATFFAQLLWLNRAVIPQSGSHRTTLRSALADAVARLFTSPDPGWEMIYWHGDPEPTLGQSYTEPTARMVWIASLTADAPTFRAQLGTWLDERLVEIATKWRDDHVYNAANPIALITHLKAVGLMSDPVLDAAKVFVSVEVGSAHAYRWRQALALREIYPDAFTAEEWETLVARYEAWAVDELTNGGADDEAEVDDIVATAKSFGIDLDDTLVSNAASQAHDAEEEAERRAAEARADRSVIDDARPRRVPQTGDDAAVRSLFRRLEAG